MADAQHHERAVVTASNGSIGERQRAGAAVRWALGLATAAMIVWLAVRYWDDLRRIDLQVDAVGLVAAVFVSMIVGAVVGLVTLPWTLAGAGGWWRRIDGLMRRVVVLRWLSGRMQTDALNAERAAVWRAVFIYGLAVAQRLMASVLLAGALLAAGVDDIWLIAGATAAGIVVGMVGITPAGLGVREVVVAALLAERFGVGDAAAFAIAVRVLEFAHELVLLPLAAAAGRTKLTDS